MVGWASSSLVDLEECAIEMSRSASRMLDQCSMRQPALAYGGRLPVLNGNKDYIVNTPGQQ